MATIKTLKRMECGGRDGSEKWECGRLDMGCGDVIACVNGGMWGGVVYVMFILHWMIEMRQEEYISYGVKVIRLARGFPAG